MATNPQPDAHRDERRMEDDLRDRVRNRLELRCSGCGYGAVASAPPLCCPMCGNDVWELSPRHLFPAAPRH